MRSPYQPVPLRSAQPGMGTPVQSGPPLSVGGGTPHPTIVPKSKPRYKKHVIRLSVADREELETKIRAGSGSRRDLVRAKAILLSDASELGPGYTDERIAAETGLSVRTIETLRKRFKEEGLSSAVSWRHRLPPPLPPHSA